MTETEAKLIGAIECYTKLKASLSDTYLASHVVQEMQEAFIQMVTSIASNAVRTQVVTEKRPSSKQPCQPGTNF